jgi:hypothetical protein
MIGGERALSSIPVAVQAEISTQMIAEILIPELKWQNAVKVAIKSSQCRDTLGEDARLLPVPINRISLQSVSAQRKTR